VVLSIEITRSPNAITDYSQFPSGFNYFFENDFDYFRLLYGFPQTIAKHGSDLRTELGLIFKLRTEFRQLNFLSADRVLLVAPLVLQQYVL